MAHAARDARVSRPAVLGGPVASVAALRIRPAAQPPAGTVTAPPPDIDGQVANVLSGSATNVVQAGSIGTVTLEARSEEAPPDPTPWLRAVWNLAAWRQARVELRFLRPVGSQGVQAYLLVRAPGPDAAVDVTVQLCQHLPAYLRGVPVTDQALLHGVLAPFRPDPAGVAEIGKCVTARRTSRGDATTPWLTAVTPWRRHGSAWPRIWADLPAATLVSVGLLPFRVGDNLKLNLQARAAEFGYLAQPGPSPTSTVFGAGRAPDQFALAAAPVLADAVGRYTDEVFQIRVSVASAHPLSDHFAHRLAQAISPGRPDTGLAGRPATVLRPLGPESLVAWRNITELGFDPLPSCRAQGLPPEALGPLDQALTAIASFDEAAAACHLPFPASHPLFD